MSARRGKRRHEPDTPKACSSSRCPRASLHNSPQCTISISDRCVVAGWTSRWYHMNNNEHYCNECFEHVYRNPMAMGAYIEWQRWWNADCRLDPTMKVFFAEQILPFWLRCKDCGKWRRVDCIDVPTTGTVGKKNTEWSQVVNADNTIKDFTCGQYVPKGDAKPETCSTPEDECVGDALGVFWLADLGYLPFLLSSPAQDMLTAYFLDGVGISPVGVWKWKGKKAALAAYKAAQAAQEAAAKEAAGTASRATTEVTKGSAPASRPTAAATTAATAATTTTSSVTMVVTATSMTGTTTCTEVKMETDGIPTGTPSVAVTASAAASLPTVPRLPSPSDVTVVPAAPVAKKPFVPSLFRTSSVLRLRRHQLGKHGGPGRAKSKRNDDQDSSDDEELTKKFGYFQPFHRPGREGKARSFRPDMMEAEECLYFPEFGTLKNPTLYLGLRNLILALWNKNCTVPLTVESVMRHVLVRGMVRIRCHLEVGRILHYLTRQAYVNIGFLDVCTRNLPQIGIANRPKQPPYPRWTAPEGGNSVPSVLIIGAGPAGLSAAFHLNRLGAKVKVLEARDRVGGRVYDDTSLGTTVGRGAQIVNGCINNPIGVLCKQAGIPMRRLNGHCALVNENGKCAEGADDEHVEQFFNILLDLVGDWRQQQLAEEERLATAASSQSSGKSTNRASKRSRQKSSGSRRSSTDERAANSRNSSKAATPTKCPLNSKSGTSSPSGGAVPVSSALTSHAANAIRIVTGSLSPSSVVTTAPSSQTSAGDTLTAQVRTENAAAGSPKAQCKDASLSPSPSPSPLPSNEENSSGSHQQGNAAAEACSSTSATSATGLPAAGQLISPGVTPTSSSSRVSSLQDIRQLHSAQLELKSDQSYNDTALQEMLEKAKRAFSDLIPDGGLQEDQERLLDFHFGNLEYSCGATLDKVSAMFWDQNDHYPQFSGDHTVMVDGFSPILNKLAENLDIQLNTAVSSIDYSDKVIQVKTEGGEQLPADFVIVTAPLSLLKREVIAFTPALPDWKLEAIQHLGAGLIEKVALRFPRRFWAHKVKSGDFFGHIPTGAQARGLCGVFYDLSRRGQVMEGVLMTIVSGKALEMKSETPAADLVAKVVALLRKMFPEETVPEPIDFFVSSWSSDPWAGMSYSYVSAGGSGVDYERLAEPVLNRLLFAGEATNRQHPQTVTGAFLSGVREAARVADMAL